MTAMTVLGKYVPAMFNKEQSVEECDATEA